MTRTYCFSNQKGGVGKTTTAVNLTSALALRGYKVLLIDFDPQGNATSGLGIDKTNLKQTIYDLLIGRTSFRDTVISSSIDNLSLLPSHSELTGAEIELIDTVGREFILKSALKEGGSAFDLIFIDCPPSLNLLTLNAMTASWKVLIPLQCEYYALEGLGQLLNTIRLVKQRLNPELEVGGVILTMADFRTNLTQQVIEEVKRHFQDKVYKSIIPRSVRLSEAPSFGKPALFYDPQSKGSRAYQDLADEFLEREGFGSKGAVQDRVGEAVGAGEP